MKIKLFQWLVCLCIAGLVGAGCSQESKKSGYLQRAEAFFQKGDYDRAEIEYMNVLRLERTNQVALRHLGEMAYESGRLSHAYALLSAARELAPEDFEVRLKLAMVLLGGGKPKEARAEVVLLLQRQPTNEGVLMLLADSSVATNEVKDARQRLAALASTSGNTPGYHLAQGILQIRNGNLPAAEESFRKALSLDAKSSAAHMALGNLYLARKDMTNALEQFKASADLAPARSPYRLRYASALMMKGDSPAAREVLEAVSKEAPDYLPALLGLTQLALADQRLQDAEGMLKSLLQRDPNHVEGILLQARLRMAQEQPDKALAELERALKVAPRVPQIQYQMALVYLQQNDLPNALKSLNQALAIQPDWMEAALLLAELNIRRGDAGSAISILTRLATQNPGMPRVQMLLATAYRAAGNSDSALRIYEAFSRSFPTNPQPVFLMGLVQQQQGKSAEARASFEKSLSIDPDFKASVEQLVNLDMAEKQFTVAEARARKQMERAPSNAAPCLLLARILYAETNFSAAEEVLNQATALEPDSPAPQALLAQIYVASGKKEAALKKFTGLVARNTNDVASWMQIAQLHAASSNYVAGREAYETILAINPRHGPALNNLTYLYSEYLGDQKRAYELGSKVRDLYPNDPYTADTFGWVLYRNGDYTRALGLIQESARRFSEQPEVLYHLGMTHYMMGEEAAARVALQNAVQLGAPDAAWRPVAQDRLRVLSIDPATADESAVKALEGLSSRLPNDPILLARLAAVAERSGDWKLAAQSYEKALVINTNLVPAMVKLAGIYAAPLKDLPRALELARRARNLDPSDPAVAHLLGQIALDSARSSSDFQWAMGLLQESGRSLPDDPEVGYDLARASFAVGQVSNAVVAMQKVAAAKPPFSHAREAALFLEMHSLLQNPGAEASARVTAVLQSQPDYVPALLVSALLLEKRGDLRAARDVYERVLALAPMFAPAFKSLAVLYSGGELNDLQKAYDFASKAREAFPEDRQVARLLGGLAYRRGTYPAAIQLLKESAPAYPSDADLFYMLGLAQHKTKLVSDSRQSLTKALSLNPDSSFAAEARTTLAELK